MIKAPIDLQDLRRRLYAKVKVDRHGALSAPWPRLEEVECSVVVRRAWTLQGVQDPEAASEDSVSSTIGFITLGTKRSGERCVGNPHAAFDVEGAGNGVTVRSTRARTGKPGRQTRPRPHAPPRQPSTLPGSRAMTDRNPESMLTWELAPICAPTPLAKGELR